LRYFPDLLIARFGASQTLLLVCGFGIRSYMWTNHFRTSLRRLGLALLQKGRVRSSVGALLAPRWLFRHDHESRVPNSLASATLLCWVRNTCWCTIGEHNASILVKTRPPPRTL